METSKKQIETPVRENYNNDFDFVIAFYEEYIIQKYDLSYKAIAENIGNIAEQQKKPDFKKHESNVRQLLKGEKKKLQSDYIDFLATITLDFEVNLSKKNNSNNYLLRDTFFEKFKQSYLANDEISKRFETPDSFLANRYNIIETEAALFATAFPQTLFSVIDNRNFPKEHIKKIAYYTNSIGLEKKGNTLITLNNKTVKTAWLGHALSGYQDSIFLYFELGRLRRFADLFDIETKLFLIDLDWANNNHSVLKLKKEIANDVDDNLRKCRVFRLNLYKQLGIAVDKDINIANVQIEISKKRRFDSRVITKTSEQYAELSEKLRENRELKDFVTHLANLLLNQDRNTSFKHTENKELNTLFKFLSPQQCRNILEIIKLMAENFGVEYENFHYVFSQYYIQKMYSDSVKLGVISEERFDRVFNKLDVIQKFEDNLETTHEDDTDNIEKQETNHSVPHSMYHLYFDNYKCTTSNNKDLTVVPYYFPSGEVGKAYTTLSSALQEVILIFDYENEEGKSKIKTIINRMTAHNLALQMSDFFSFIFYFFPKTEYYKGLLEDIIKDFNPELADSFSHYTKPENEVKITSEKIFTMFYDREPLQVHFFPYLFYMQAKNDLSFDDKLRQFYVDLIIAVLRDVSKVLHINNWTTPKHKAETKDNER